MLKKESKLIQINDLSVSYIYEGPEDAPVIVFLHGFPLNKSIWNDQMDALRGHYRVMAYDVRGHGDSAEGTGRFSMEMFAEDLISLMDALAIERASLVGLSMGGYIALEAIDKYPERFSALVLANTQCAADKPQPNNRKPSDIFKEMGREKWADERLTKLFSPTSQAHLPGRLAAVKAMIMGISNTALISVMHAFNHRKETCHALGNIAVPVMILVGREDVVTPVAASELMKIAMPKAEMHIIENAGHLSNLENPDVFNAHLIQFFTGVFEVSKSTITLSA